MQVKNSLIRLLRFRKWLCGVSSINKTAHSIYIFRKWLFIGTTFAELVNSLFIIGFSGAMIANIVLNDSSIFELGSYRDFQAIGLGWWIAFLCLGVLQGLSMYVPSIRASKISGLCLVLSSAIWAFLAGTFISSKDGLITTAPLVYLTWAIGTALSGYERINTGKKKEKALIKE